MKERKSVCVCVCVFARKRGRRGVIIMRKEGERGKREAEVREKKMKVKKRE